MELVKVDIMKVIGIPNVREFEYLINSSNFWGRVNNQFSIAIFTRIYANSMNLIEKVSNYIDGPGREITATSSSEVASLYAGEAMATSTRLMQVASWLLLIRSALEGDMSAETVLEEKEKLSLNTPAQTSNKLWTALPKSFIKLVEESLSLEARVRHLNELINQSQDKNCTHINLVHQQQEKLRKAFAL